MLSDPEVIEYRKQEKEVSALIQKNLKLKSQKKPEEPITRLNPIEYDQKAGSNPLDSHAIIDLEIGSLSRMENNQKQEHHAAEFHAESILNRSLSGCF